MIIEAAIADAIAVAFEYNDNPTFPNDLSGYHDHPRHPIGRGRYSDDTEASTAVLEWLLAGDHSREALANQFVTVFNRERRRGYASGYYDFLCSVSDGTEFLKKIKPYSDKSGAAMRGWTLGTIKDQKELRELSQLQAETTHATPGGIQSAHAAALMLHYFLYEGGRRGGLINFIEAREPGPWAWPWYGKVGPKGVDAVQAAISAVMQHDTLGDILMQCIAYGGDTDTVATIAIGAASCSREVRNNLPAHLYDGLEAGDWGMPYLRALDGRVIDWMDARSR